jgi:hypothetical protein
VELALFLDHTGFKTFHAHYSKDELVEMLLASVNQLTGIYHLPSLGQRVDFSIVKLEVHEVEEAFDSGDGERMKMLESFCR